MNYEMFKLHVQALKRFGGNDLELYNIVIKSFDLRQFDDESLEQIKSDFKKALASSNRKFLDYFKFDIVSNQERKKAQDNVEKIDLILDFRKRKSKAIDVEVKGEKRVISDGYIESLISFIIKKLPFVGDENRAFISVKFDAALSCLENNPSSIERENATRELESIADIMIELTERSESQEAKNNLGR